MGGSFWRIPFAKPTGERKAGACLVFEELVEAGGLDALKEPRPLARRPAGRCEVRGPAARAGRRGWRGGASACAVVVSGICDSTGEGGGQFPSALRCASVHLRLDGEEKSFFQATNNPILTNHMRHDKNQ